ncbi:MAG: WD40 repeat domain-containing protein [Myxococcales bacterium]|nr:WD40 repeat domain-containing protein [Myxococcales bacterium]
MLTGSDRDTARLWDVRSGAVLRVFRAAVTQPFPSEGVAVALSGDGALAVTAWTGEVQLWNANTGALVRSIAGPQRGMPIIALSKNSEHLFVTGRDEAVVQVWDVRTGASLRTLVGHRGAVTALAVMGDSTIASAGVDRTVRVWNARSGELRHVLPQRDAVSSISLIEERDELLVSLDAGGIVRYRAISQSSSPFPVALQEFDDAVDTVAPLGDGRTLMALERAPARLNLWDYGRRPDRYTRRMTLSASGPFAASRDGSRIVAATTSEADSDATATVGVWSGRVGDLPQGYNPFGDEAYGFLPDGVRVFVHHRGALWVWNTHSDRIERRCERGREDGAVASTSGSRLSVYADESRVLRGADVIDTRTCALVWRLPVAGDLTASALFSGDSLIVTGASTGIVQLWDARTGALLRSFDGHRGEINAVAGSPDGSRVLTASNDQTSRLWNARTGELLQTIRPGRRALTAAFANNQLFFVAGRDEHEVESRDVRSGRVVRVFRSPSTEWPRQAFVLGDGSRVLIDGFARIWQTHTATPFDHTLYSPREPDSVAPDGSRFVNRGLVVPLTIAAWIEHVCLRISSSDLWMEPTMRDVRAWCSDRASAAIGANRSQLQAMAALDAGHGG